MKAVILILLFGLNCLTACKKPNDPGAYVIPPNFRSEVKFDFSGDTTGSYYASGEAPEASTVHLIWNYTWGAGIAFSDFGNWIGVYGNIPVDTALRKYADITIQFPAKGVGTYPLPSARYGDEVNFEGVGTNFFEFKSGFIKVTTYQLNRVTGTFLGTAVNPNKPGSHLEISGSFDVLVKPG